MVDPFQIATDGVGPGWTTFNMATMGFGFEIEIEIKPVQGTGGGYRQRPDLPYYEQDYEVIVRIKYKGKTWEQRKRISAIAAKSLEKVLATFRRMQTSTIEVASSFINIIQRKVSVLVKRL